MRLAQHQLTSDDVLGDLIASNAADQQGRYEIKGLPPTDYVAVAVESLEQGGEWDPAAFEIRNRKMML